MLVLARKPSEEITITDSDTGEVITITLVRCNEGNSRIGITASDRYKIMRSELVEDESLAELPQGG